MKPAFLMEFPNAPAGDEAQWNAWLEQIRMPACLAVPGIYSARRYAADEGDRRYFNFVGLTDIGVVAGEHYRKWQDASTFKAGVTTPSDDLYGFYSQIYPKEGGYREPGAATVLVIGHDVSAQHEDEYHAWYETEHIPIHLRLPGFLRAYRFVAIQDERVPHNQSSGPKYITMYEVENEGVFRTPEYDASRHSPWTHWMRRFYKQRFRSVFKHR